jgi:phospholipase C
LIPANLVDHTIYDHTSLLATVENLYGFQPLTNRDVQANTLNHLFSLNTPRTDAPSSLPEPANSGFSCEDDTSSAKGSSSSGLTGESGAGVANRTAADDSITPVQRAFLHIAFLRDYHRTSFLGKPAVIRRFLKIKTATQALEYMESVRRRMPTVRVRSTERKPRS